MDKIRILSETEKFVKEKMQADSTGHDWWHVDRVRKNALKIADNEGGDSFIIELGALLHDIADWKFVESSDFGASVAREWLVSTGVDESMISQVCEIIMHISFKGAGEENKMKSIEGKIVQDADRLDALGAIGIARCFATGSKFGNSIYDPNLEVMIHKSFVEYKSAKTTSINHFYEKLLLLKDKMNTETGRQMATERHKFMEEFLERFYDEFEEKE